MSKKTFFISFLSVLLLLSISSSNFLSHNLKLESKVKKNQNVNEVMVPKSSGYMITEEWNYTTPSIADVIISEDGNYIALSHSSFPANLSLFNRNSNDTLWNIAISFIDSVDISGNGKYISVTGGRATENVYLYNNTPANPSWSKKFMWRYYPGGSLISSISWNGEYVVVANDTWIHLIDNEYQTGNKIPEWMFDCGSAINAIDIGYSPLDNKYYITVGTSDGFVYLFNETNPNLVGPIWSNNTASSIDQLKISEDGSYILAKNSDDEVYLFNNDLEIPKLALWNYTTSNHRNIDISDDGKNIIIVEQTKINYLNNTPSTSKQPIWEATTMDDSYEGEISGNGKYILVGGYSRSPVPSGYAKLYNSTKTLPKIVESEILEGNDIFHITINYYGNYFAIIEDTNVLHFYHYDVPLPIVTRSSSGSGDDEDGDNAAIPFGNYYLIFACAAIISLIIIVKRKINFKLI